jgi:hypothetical protein
VRFAGHVVIRRRKIRCFEEKMCRLHAWEIKGEKIQREYHDQRRSPMVTGLECMILERVYGYLIIAVFTLLSIQKPFYNDHFTCNPCNLHCSAKEQNLRQMMHRHSGTFAAGLRQKQRNSYSHTPEDSILAT